MKFQICPYCQAHLDFGEKCDCQKDNQEIVTVVRNTETIDKEQKTKKG